MVVQNDKSLSSLIGTFPQPFNKEEEREIFEEYQRSKCVELYKEIIYRNLRFVAHIVNQFKTTANELDMFQEGTIGLMKSVDKFDPSRKNRFVSFAVRFIKTEINEYIIKNLSVVRSLTTKPLRKLFFNSKLSHNNDTKTTAKKLNVSTNDVNAYKVREVGFHDTETSYYNSQDEDTEISMIDDLNYNLLDDIIETDEAAMQQQQLIDGLRDLSDRDREVLISSYINGETLHTIAAKFGISAERVRQLKIKAIKNIQKGF